jgi:MYXO-CTERM domain-containing protein
MKRRLLISMSAFSASVSIMGTGSAATLTVGPGQTYSTPCAAIGAASAGDTVAVSPGAASYTDSCEINVAGLTVKGVGGRPTIDLSGTMDPADDKGIYVVNADNVTLDNLELTGANVDLNDGLNGAGVRVQGDGLTVINCYIHDNQDGILATAAAAGYSLTVEYTEFAHNGLGAGCDNGGCTHNIYVGTGAGGDFETFVFAFNWSHDIADDTSDKGHLVKTRAQNNYILYNALLGETGHDSIELDIPNGGFSVVMGNIIEKGPNSDDNPNLLSYGEEGLTNPTMDLYVDSNTFVSNYASSVTFINVASGGTLTAHNNFFNGTGTLASTGALSADNLLSTMPMFVDPTTYDYHLMSGSPAIGKGVAPGTAAGFSLVPTYEYVQPTESVPRAVAAMLDLGAFQFGTSLADAGQTGTVTLSDAGTPNLPDASSPPPTDGGGSHTSGDGGAAQSGDSGLVKVADGGTSHARDGGHTQSGADAAGLGDAGQTASSSGGCGCRVGAPSSAPGSLAFGLVVGVPLLMGRRRHRKG